MTLSEDLTVYKILTMKPVLAKDSSNHEERELQLVKIHIVSNLKGNQFSVLTPEKNVSIGIHRKENTI